MQRRQRRADKRPDTDTCGQGSPAGGSKPANRSLIDHSPAQATLAAPGRGKPAAIPSFLAAPSGGFTPFEKKEIARSNEMSGEAVLLLAVASALSSCTSAGAAAGVTHGVTARGAHRFQVLRLRGGSRTVGAYSTMLRADWDPVTAAREWRKAAGVSKSSKVRVSGCPRSARAWRRRLVWCYLFVCVR